MTSRDEPNFKKEKVQEVIDKLRDFALFFTFAIYSRSVNDHSDWSRSDKF